MKNSDWLTKKIDGYIAYKFATGNLVWIFLVTSHRIRSYLQPLFLQENGLLKAILSRYDEKTQLMKIAQTFGRIEGK